MKRISALFTNSLAIKIAAAIAVMLVLAVVSIGAVFQMVNGQKTDGVVINEAGRLRMLSQKMAKASFMIALGESSAQDELVATASLFDKGFNAVRYSN